MSQIAASSICKSYGDFKALHDVSMEISKGEFLTFLGPSGSGKTTFLMILAGFTEQTSGQLMKDGRDISAMAAEERNFGMVFQGYALFPHMTVWQNVDYPLRVRKMGSAERKQKVGRIIETVGLAEHAHKKPSQLSGGQQQRVALARSLVFQPDVLLLDEPLSALDRNLREQMQSELKRVHEETGTTFVFVTHDQGEALAMSDKIAIFNKGRLMQLATPDHIYNAPDSRFVAEFLGQINIFPVASPGIDGGLLRGNLDGTTLSAANPGNRVNGTASIAVRPEHMTLSAERPADQANVLPARVIQTTYQGSHSDLVLQTPQGHSISASTHNANGALPSVGSDLWVGWSPENSIVIAD
ncbi:spermidine/putrescine ABC transporter [Leisingera sp. ANG-M1]|uniref:ABC transporter ATP-binding protein n=1 Tax=Leisingera sp. ANG-M1 TaxID=1577895 RepID=UPI00057D6A16|nr:ABC transporter ATP-binding protein [Leisingera sp. ANG-M1]KIC08028.1 spermidine/putrescine ABC transporter [Leisingera sp. ANG-M1]